MEENKCKATGKPVDWSSEDEGMSWKEHQAKQAAPKEETKA